MDEIQLELNTKFSGAKIMEGHMLEGAVPNEKQFGFIYASIKNE